MWKCRFTPIRYTGTNRKQTFFSINFISPLVPISHQATAATKTPMPTHQIKVHEEECFVVRLPGNDLPKYTNCQHKKLPYFLCYSPQGKMVILRNNPTITSKEFQRLVNLLKEKGKTCAVAESSCGGVINASVMAVPGSSAVYYGGSVAYNTRKAKKFLLNDSELHNKLTQKYQHNIQSNVDAKHEPSPSSASPSSRYYNEGGEGIDYIRSKLYWTAETAKAFCEQLDVDYAIAEGGATGPTFRPNDMKNGFAVVAIAGRDGSEQERQPSTPAHVLAQAIIHSTHADRVVNMRQFADAAAKLAADTIEAAETQNTNDYDDADVDKLSVSEAVEWSLGDKEMEGKASKEEDSNWLDRATHLRSDEEALKELERHPDAQHVIIRNDAKECLFASATELALVGQEGMRHFTSSPSSIGSKTFLGLDRREGNRKNSPIFSVNLREGHHSDEDGTHGTDELTRDMYFDNVRTHAPLLTPTDNELALYATAMAQWQNSYKFCPQCGQPLTLIQGGTCMKGTGEGCQLLWWPRQDPSIIVLITNRTGDKALLARSPRHPNKVHTALAGFVEAGETFERAVQREAEEETGVIVDPTSITYLSSQPWPFPRSCMIGFRATADDSLPLTIDPNEIVSATWFEKDQVEAAAHVSGSTAVMNHKIAESMLQQHPNLDLLIPPRGVLARSLIDNWLEDGI